MQHRATLQNIAQMSKQSEANSNTIFGWEMSRRGWKRDIQSYQCKPDTHTLTTHKGKHSQTNIM